MKAYVRLGGVTVKWDRVRRKCARNFRESNGQ